MDSGFMFSRSGVRHQASAAVEHAGPETHSDHGRSTPTSVAPSIGFISNLRLADADTTTTFAVVSAAGVGPATTILTPRFVGQLLGSQVPALPSWFTAGFLSAYGQMRFGPHSITLGRLKWPASTAPSMPSFDDEALIPLQDFLIRDSLAHARDPARWLAQAELFVRWGLDPNSDHRDAFWRFLESISTQAPVAQTFEESFGFDLSEGTLQLTQYLTVARKTSTRWSLPVDPSTTLEIRDATWSEVARIKGEWERLIARYVRKEIPEVEKLYVDQARRTLQRAYDRADRDPRLLATLGLLELESGNETLALSHLEQAAQRSIQRPRVYFELAKMRYDYEAARTTSRDGKLAIDNAAKVLDLLLKARDQKPPLSPVYELFADVWLHSAIQPGADALAVIDEGSSLFPGCHELIHRAAELYSNAGNRERALELLELGLQHAATESAKSSLSELRSALLPDAIR